MRYWDIQFSLSVNLSLSAPHLNELAGYEIPSTLLASIFSLTLSLASTGLPWLFHRPGSLSSLCSPGAVVPFDRLVSPCRLTDHSYTYHSFLLATFRR